ncbi:MAG: hypothetical protein LBE18_06670, partial [Planctomycetaceae bacterium]|nr:hypothetical protein [Planctomycetaceae bacterium]
EERRKAEEYHRKVVEESRKADEEHPKKIDELFEDNFYSFEENFNRFGEVPEYLVALKIFNCFNEIGYNFVVLVRGGVEILENDQVIARIDILLENKKTIAVVMVNPEPTLKDIKKYLKLMSIARKHYDKLGRSDKDLIGVVAGDIFPDNVKKFTIETGFYVIVPDGETLKIEVPENFKPKIFKH